VELVHYYRGHLWVRWLMLEVFRCPSSCYSIVLITSVVVLIRECWAWILSLWFIKWGLEFFLFTTTSRTALGPTQPPIQLVPGSLSLEVKRPGREADHSLPSAAEVKECPHSPNTPSWRGAQLEEKHKVVLVVAKWLVGGDVVISPESFRVYRVMRVRMDPDASLLVVASCSLRSTAASIV
jgi:hypothetical protein